MTLLNILKNEDKLQALMEIIKTFLKTPIEDNSYVVNDPLINDSPPAVTFKIQKEEWTSGPSPFRY